MDDLVAWVVFLGGLVLLTAGCRWAAARLAPPRPDDEDAR